MVGAASAEAASSLYGDRARLSATEQIKARRLGEQFVQRHRLGGDLDAWSRFRRWERRRDAHFGALRPQSKRAGLSDVDGARETSRSVGRDLARWVAENERPQG